jgi:predicted phage terminase large subunit-like protein
VLPLAAADLACYAQLVYPGFELPWHLELLVDHLEAVERGEIKRLMIFKPPRHGGSLTSVRLFPSWYLGRNPGRSVIVATYGQDLGDDHGRAVRNFLADPIHTAVFPACKLSSDSSAINRFSTTGGGGAFFVGRLGPITGRGASLAIIDDPIKDAEEARSETVRRTLLEWYRSVLYTRLTPDGRIVLVQTRWHADDLAGTLLKEQAKEWTVLSLPAVADRDEGFSTGRDPARVTSSLRRTRKAGEALWPERFPLQVLESIRSTIGGSAWAALYQQNPIPESGSLISPSWIRRWSRADLPSAFDEVCQSWDLALTGTGDPVAGHVWARAGGNFYLLDRVYQRLDFPSTLGVIRQLSAKWPQATGKYVEKAAAGAPAIAMLKNEIPGLIPVEPEGSKAARLASVSMLFESANVFLMPGGDGDEVAAALTGFPHCSNDHDVDACVYGLRALMRREVSGGWIIQRSEPQFTIGGLRDFLNREPQRPVHPDFGRAIVDGRGLEDVSDEQLDNFLFGTGNLG